MENLGTLIAATGALGVAAFGIVEAMKWTPLGRAGFGTVLKRLGPLDRCLEAAYGRDYEKMLEAQYRGDRRDLTRTLRQGIRVGLSEDCAQEVAEFVGVVDGESLAAAAGAAKRNEVDDEEQGVLAEFELAVDARIEAALVLAQSYYSGAMRLAASFVALAIALVVGFYLANGESQGKHLVTALVVGVAAVPLAPITKDLVSAIQAAGRALGWRP